MHKVLRVGVVGVGYLGTRHAQIYAQIPGVRLVAVCDVDSERAHTVARSLDCQAFTDHKKLIGLVDAVSLAVPTTSHAPVGRDFLRRGVHLLIEKPICTTLTEANVLIRLAAKHHALLQVGHVERFNAAIEAALKKLSHPRFIEVHRLSPYPSRGTDVSVVLDVMIHDLDLVLALVRSRLRRVEALGIAVLSRSEDLANARVVFASGCVANLTASRIHDESIRRIRVFQDDCYLSIDYKAQTVEMAHRKGKNIRRVHLPVNPRPPLQEELASFIRAVMSSQKPVVSGEDGRAALDLALRIERAIHRHRTAAISKQRTERQQIALSKQHTAHRD